ncbi:putative membrane protein DUF2207 [Antricoccus suffuscus]|uniref:Putative membrane protein DUF2207 n=1 Tax=Antricoccus suffuscus TaxID=1629062 RepID=A0A2T0ZW99_9ACTN|nr:DUF2207 domain-containing protein [Antricoccus suffuscus]PRZ40603.1 putative membrane protein DUF2207 [Antricoccus suffuscus]
MISTRLTGRRAITAAFLLVLFAALALAGFTQPAHADSGDKISKYDISYVVEPDGTVQVKETIDYEFSGGSRHGIYRNLAIRGPYPGNDNKDREYQIDNFAVSSPTGASTAFKKTVTQSDGGRSATAQYQIGSANQYVDSAETYVLTYDIKGALNPQKNADTEFFWNATGNGWDAQINNVSIDVTVPGGPQKIKCVQGPQGSTQACETAEVQGDKAVFFAAGGDSSASYGVTFDVAINPSKVDATPILVDRATWLNQHGFTLTNGIIGAIGVILVGVFGARTSRRMRDQRFTGVPPGVVPSKRELAAGGGIGVITDKGDIHPPVAFSPPKGMSPAEAAELMGGNTASEALPATVLDLAYRGVIRIHEDPTNGSEPGYIELVDASKATAAHERLLVDGMFPYGNPGEVCQLSAPTAGEPNKFYDGYVAMNGAVRTTVLDQKLYRPNDRYTRKSIRGLGVFLLAAGIIGSIWASSAHPTLVLWLVAAAVAGVVLLAIATKAKGSGLTATGRARLDQIEGFRTYLGTAEADQLRFEEGEDIFSRYLPWAVIFDMTERWSKICATLIEQGRIPAQPDWYIGNYSGFMAIAMISSLNSSISQAAAPPPSVNSGGGGGGFGGGSGFGGGGFSGGGGGGGGGGSW